MRSINTKHGSLLILEYEDLDLLTWEQRGAVLTWMTLSKRVVTKSEGQRLFGSYDGLLYRQGPKRAQPTTPLDVEHEDIRSERPCT